MRIAISGKSGCGNTTVSTLVAHMLGYKLINYTFRNMALERGIDFWEFHKMAQADDSIDIELDKTQVEMAMSQQSCVLGSRLAIWVLKEADLKVYLRASDHLRASRIQQREGGDLEHHLQKTLTRDAKDSERYKRLYNIDNNDPSVADLIIDTEELTASEVATLIVEEAQKRIKKTPSHKG